LFVQCKDRRAVQHLSDALSGHPSLCELDISGSSMPIVAIVNEMDFLCHNTVLESLVVSVSVQGWADDEEELIGSMSGLLENNTTLLDLRIYRYAHLSSNQRIRNATSRKTGSFVIICSISTLRTVFCLTCLQRSATLPDFTIVYDAG
jgi:hypothetical protein